MNVKIKGDSINTGKEVHYRALKTEDSDQFYPSVEFGAVSSEQATQ